MAVLNPKTLDLLAGGREMKEPDGEENPSGPLLFNPRLLLTVVVFTPYAAYASLLR